MELIKQYNRFYESNVVLWIDNEEIENGAMEQIQNVSELPFLHKHVAVLPDVHQGYGMPIGTVACLDGVISPNMVGVDIGCGMSAIRLGVKASDIRPFLSDIMADIRSEVPMGFNRRTKGNTIHTDNMPNVSNILLNNKSIVMDNYQSAISSLGTLGGGNHFIEIQEDEDGDTWVMVHSGSRGLGKKVCDHYNKIAVDMNERYHSGVPKSHGLAFLPVDSKEGSMYIEEMKYCESFAYANRMIMIRDILSSIKYISGLSYITGLSINIAHNYARLEHHFGKNVWVHRKGATSAKEDEIGIIPGSQGSSSYIVRGLGNPLSYTSCSHGAGRRMSRKKAKETLDLEVETELLNDIGVVHGMRNTGDLDEAPSAYKDIDKVMVYQKDLVEVMYKLKPICVMKGTGKRKRKR